ncbi:MAG: HdeA/HdeB family chaperone [Candidatus Binatia bacterium]
MRQWRMVVGIAVGIWAVAVTGTTARAADAADPEKITCEQFLAMDEDEREHTAYWVEGWAVAKGKMLIGGLPLQSMNRPAGPIAEACKKDPKATLIQVLPQHFK